MSEEGESSPTIKPESLLRVGILPLIVFPPSVEKQIVTPKYYLVVGQTFFGHLDFLAGQIDRSIDASPLDGARRETCEETSYLIRFLTPDEASSDDDEKKKSASVPFIDEAGTHYGGKQLLYFSFLDKIASQKILEDADNDYKKAVEHLEAAMSTSFRQRHVSVANSKSEWEMEKLKIIEISSEMNENELRRKHFSYHGIEQDRFKYFVEGLEAILAEISCGEKDPFTFPESFTQKCLQWTLASITESSAASLAALEKGSAFKKPSQALCAKCGENLRERRIATKFCNGWLCRGIISAVVQSKKRADSCILFVHRLASKPLASLAGSSANADDDDEKIDREEKTPSSSSSFSPLLELELPLNYKSFPSMTNKSFEFWSQFVRVSTIVLTQCLLVEFLPFDPHQTGDIKQDPYALIRHVYFDQAKFDALKKPTPVVFQKSSGRS